MSDIAITLVQQNKAHDYYYTREWVRIQAATMRAYKRECLRCKVLSGVIEPAHILHHVKRLKDEPEYADTPFVQATKRDKQAAAVSTIRVRQYYDGKFYNYICIDYERYERYYVQETGMIVQLLPVCRQCHKDIHQSVNVPKPGSLDEKFPEFL